MKLEVGKTYKTREGQTVVIIGDDGRSAWPFGGEMCGRIGHWNRDGTWIDRRQKHIYDIVKEVKTDGNERTT